MHSKDPKEKAAVDRNQKQTCPKCSFENHPTAVYCEICFYPLSTDSFDIKEAKIHQSQPTRVRATTTPHTSLGQELKRPSVLSGLGVLGLAIALWINYLVPPATLSTATDSEITLYNSMRQVKDVPQGLFSYGGALYFASLVAHGMNEAMMQSHPNFYLRYTKPINQDQSYANAIKMLLQGELSFAFNGRPLTDREYSRANLRKIGLQQVPIAIDGIVFFGNNSISVDNLSLDLVRDIFTGKIDNWQQLGGADLPITPVLLTPENLAILGLSDTANIATNTQYVDNYTLALRKVIATPGAISFASASLAQQQAIKVFNLAAENSTNYVSPFVAEEPNLPSFKSGTYPLTRRLFIVTREDGTPEESAGIAYTEMLLSKEGQEIVKQSGFVPLYETE